MLIAANIHVIARARAFASPGSKPAWRSEPVQKPFRPAELRQILSSLRSKAFQADAATLQAAIEDNELELFYQPLLTLSTRQTIGFEALVRWRHPDFGRDA